MNTEPTPVETVCAPEQDPWPQRKRDVRTREWRIYEKLLNKLEVAIDRLLEDSGASLNPADIARLLELAAKLGRLAAGLPSDHTAHSIQDDRTVRVEISAAIKKIYSEPLEAIVARMRGSDKPTETINVDAPPVTNN
jgi:hypothetical protein